MRKLIISIFSGLIVLTILALILTPNLIKPGKTRIVWVSDANPERSIQIKKFNDQNPDMEVVLDVNNRDNQKILLQCSSGVGPDLFDCANGTMLQFFSEAGITDDITEPAKKLGISTSDTWPTIYNELTYLDHQVSYPANVGVDILLYNKNIFDQLRVDYPKQDMTWDEFIELAQKVNVRDGKNKVYGMINRDNEVWALFFYSMRGEFFSKDGTRLLMESDAMKKAFLMHQDCIFKYNIVPTSKELKASLGQGGFGKNQITPFAEGKYGMIFIGRFSLIGFRNALRDQRLRMEKYEKDPNSTPRPELLRLGAAPMPHFPGLPNYSLVHSRSVAVNAKSPNREKALRFLKFLSGPEYSRCINEGCDSTPGNPVYAMEGFEEVEPELAERDIHEICINGIKQGYTPKNSPFLPTQEVLKILKLEREKMELIPDSKVEDLLADAQKQLEAMMQRNLDRSPKLMEEYHHLTGSHKVLKPEESPVPAEQAQAK